MFRIGSPCSDGSGTLSSVFGCRFESHLKEGNSKISLIHRFNPFIIYYSFNSDSGRNQKTDSDSNSDRNQKNRLGFGFENRLEGRQRKKKKLEGKKERKTKAQTDPCRFTRSIVNRLLMSFVSMPRIRSVNSGSTSGGIWNSPRLMFSYNRYILSPSNGYKPLTRLYLIKFQFKLNVYFYFICLRCPSLFLLCSCILLGSR